MSEWQPTARIENLKIRARILKRLRAFFAERNILEVQTPLLSHAGTTDPAIESFTTHSALSKALYLQTSPEYHMKRLLAAGSGSIYQITPVFRREEQGKNHNPEFSMLEWYRPDFDYHALMGEVNALVHHVADGIIELESTKFISYQDAFKTYADIDPFDADIGDLQDVIARTGIDVVGMNDSDYDSWLYLIMSEIIEPDLPEHCPVFIYDFPGSQAALAKINKKDPATAERFELYINGIELANGFNELTDADEQIKRFKNENKRRKESGQQEVAIDYHLINAMQAGLPECAGVALGIERLLMVLTSSAHISEVCAFPIDNA